MADIINARDTYLRAGSRSTPLSIVLSSSITGYDVNLNAVNTSSTLISSTGMLIVKGADVAPETPK